MQEHFITAKYVERKYICLPETYPGATAQTGLWEAVEGGNLRYPSRQANMCMRDLLHRAACNGPVSVYLCTLACAHAVVFLYNLILLFLLKLMSHKKPNKFDHDSLSQYVNIAVATPNGGVSYTTLRQLLLGCWMLIGCNRRSRNQHLLCKTTCNALVCVHHYVMHLPNA